MIATYKLLEEFEENATNKNANYRPQALTLTASCDRSKKCLTHTI